MSETFSVFISGCHRLDAGDVDHHQFLVLAHAMHVPFIVARLAMAEGAIGPLVLDDAINGIFGSNGRGGLLERTLGFHIYCRRHIVSVLSRRTGGQRGEGGDGESRRVIGMEYKG